MMGFITRIVIITVSLTACVAAALVVYSALGNTLALPRNATTDLDQPVSDVPRATIFIIRPGMIASDVGDELQGKGLIRSSAHFRREVEQLRMGSRLEAGAYELSPSMRTSELVGVLGKGAAAQGRALTVIEGWRAEQLAVRVEELGLARPEELLRMIYAPRDFGIVPPDPGARNLEGFLFPDTYRLEPGTTPARLVTTLVEQFSRRFSEGHRRAATARGLTVLQAVTIASIVEREASRPDERAVVSSVYHNRLQAGMKLDADPTVQYAIASLDLRAANAYGFWKPELTLKDLQAESPYNLYRATGLPPGPICSPGLASIEAALQPAETKYLFFVSRGDGSHIFAQTAEEHQANVVRYRGR